MERIILALFFIFFSYEHGYSDEVWKDVTQNLDKDLYSIAVSPGKENIIYIGSDKSIFKTLNGGKDWHYLYTVKGEQQKVNFILFDPIDANIVYFATSNGLFKSSGSIETIEKIFRGNSETQKVIRCVIKIADTLYIGTQNGIFRSLDSGLTWTRLPGIPQDSAVSYINSHPALPNLIYAASDSGVYKSSDKGETWERIFITQKKEETAGDEEESSEEKEASQIIPLSLLVNRHNPRIVYLGTTRGLFISQDSGRNWERKLFSNLGEVEIRHIICVDKPDVLCLATNKGVFKITLNKSQAQELYRDIPTRNVRMVAIGNEAGIWAVADKGLFKTAEMVKENISQEDSYLQEYEFYFRDEPTIREVQEAAVRYAEVHPDKIKHWRAQARIKAFVPEFDLDYDKTVTTALGATYDRVQVGPRDWGMSLKWNLADLIWSTDQTSIDVRSRLMVQLRDDVLDEVNRLYFQRRRLKLELLLEPSDDLKERLEKRLRLEELTAGLNALTGGYFSRRIEELSKT